MNALEIDYRLERLATAGPADGLLVETDRAVDVLRVVGALDRAGVGAVVHAVSTGFLVLGDHPLPPRAPEPGILRVRRLGGRLYVPAQGSLSPSLLQYEMEGLTRDRGLVFLPDGRVLAFDPSGPLSAAELCEPPIAPREAWAPLPEAPARAARIVEVMRETPSNRPDDWLETGGEGIGTQENRAPGSGAPGEAMGRTRMGAGRGMLWLGQALNMPGLARLGARWMGAAMDATPRLAEGVLGRQETALRDLLRQFREGKIEDALRRALPLGQGTERGATVSNGADLPSNDLSYSLRSLMSSSGGTASYWFGGFDVQKELMREYEKAAEAATRRGDYRRAAYIHAKLLGDFKTAAAVLLRGGLAHDAAILLLERVKDPLEAALAFEAAGEFDRALHLYLEHDQYRRAGDLLQRLGETEAALEQYLRSAEQLSASPEGAHLAGEILRVKAGRPDLARPYYELGWSRRSGYSALACASELARINAAMGEAKQLLTLAAEVDAHFAAVPGQYQAAAKFFNELAALGEQPAMAAARDELRDRALICLSRRLTERGAPDPKATPMVGILFGPRAWTPDLLSDAEYAASGGRGREAPAKPAKRSPSLPRKVGQGLVTAVAFAAEREELFLGFQSGEVLRVDPFTSEVNRLALYPTPVSGLAVDHAAENLAVLWKSPSRRAVLAGYSRRPDGTFQMAEGRSERRAEHIRLASWISDTKEPIVGLWQDGRVSLLRGPGLIPVGRVQMDDAETETEAWPMLVPVPGHEVPMVVLVESSGRWTFGTIDGGVIGTRGVGWSPTVPKVTALSQPQAAVMAAGRSRVEIAGVGEGGSLFRTVLEFTEQEQAPVVVTTNLSASDLGYRAATLVRSGRVTGVTPQSVHWLRGVSTRFSRLATADHALPQVVSCHALHRTSDLLLVSRDGHLETLPMPPS